MTSKEKKTMIEEVYLPYISTKLGKELRLTPTNGRYNLESGDRSIAYGVALTLSEAYEAAHFAYKLI